MKKEITIEQIIETDVVVIGGGTAGCIAAICAALGGAKTVLIEKNGMLGGTMVTANVNFPGLFFAWGEQIIDGPCWKIIKESEVLKGAEIPPISKKPEKHWHEQIRLNRFVYSAVLDGFCKRNGVEVGFHTMLAGAYETESGIEILAACKEGMKLVKAKVAIDATGDADLTRMLGYPCVKSDILQPATLINELSGYDINDVNMDTVIRLTAKGIKNGELPEELSENSLYDYLNNHRLDLHISALEADTSEGKTALEFLARKKLLDILGFLRKIPGLENIQISFIAEECGIRETNRIIGETEITKDDYLNGVMYDDAVCYSFYPIDLHVMTGIEKTYLKAGIVPTIPYRSMIPKGAKSLFAVGRCVSSDTLANSAVRVQATCMAMGQAAGFAASIASSRSCDVLDVDYQKLCAVLEENGAIVPHR